MKTGSWIKQHIYLFLLLPGIIFVLFFLIVPFAWIIRVSFYENVRGGYMTSAWTLENYFKFLLDPWYLKNVLFKSFQISLITSVIAIVLAYPVALYVSRSSGRMKQILLTLVLSPLLIGMVCLIFGWLVIFRTNGILNQFTMWLGLNEEPIKYMYNLRGVMICLVYISIPYIVLNLLDTLSRINPSLEEAAWNIGCNKWQSFWKIIFPLSVPGMYAGSLIVFALNFCAFAVPLMIGAQRIPMIGLVMYRQAYELMNLPFASAMAVILLVVSLVFLLIYSRIVNRLFFKKLGV